MTLMNEKIKIERYQHALISLQTNPQNHLCHCQERLLRLHQKNTHPSHRQFYAIVVGCNLVSCMQKQPNAEKLA